MLTLTALDVVVVSVGDVKGIFHLISKGLLSTESYCMCLPEGSCRYNEQFRASFRV